MLSWSKAIFNKDIDRASRKQKEINRLFTSFPYEKYTLNFDGNYIDYRQIGNQQVKFKLGDLLVDDSFCNNNRVTLGDLKITISRQNNTENAVLPIIIKSDLSKTTEIVGKFHVPSNLDEVTVRLPLNNPDGKLKNKLSRKYTIDHKGFDIEIEELRVHAYKQSIETQ
jgi:hypothetical protein